MFSFFWRYGKKEMAVAETLGGHIRDNMYGVFALFIIIAGNYLGSLFSCSVQRVLNHSQGIKHFMAFMTMYFFVIVIDSDNINLPIWKQLVIMVVIYMVFILLTKCHACMTPIVVFLLFVLYCVKVYKQYNHEEELPAAWRHAETALEALTVVLLAVGIVMYLKDKQKDF